MNTSPNGIAAIKGHEAFRGRAYKPTPNDVWTIGYGLTQIYGRSVRDGDIMTQQQADADLQVQLDPYEDAIMGLCSVTPNQSQFDALVSLAYNIGIKGSSGSTVLKCHNRGDLQAAARAFNLWNKQAGKVLNGLVSRRAQEAALYLTPVGGQDPAPMPQTVDPETTFSQSKIGTGSLVATGAGVLASVQPTLDGVNALKTGVSSLGTWLVPILLILAVAGAGWALYERINLRKKGIL